MINWQKKFWSKTLLGILILGFVLMPFSVSRENDGFKISEKITEAAIKEVKVLPLNSGDIGTSSVSISVQITGIPENQTLTATLQELPNANHSFVKDLDKKVFTSIGDETVTVVLTSPAPFDSNLEYRVGANATGGGHGIFFGGWISFKGDGTDIKQTTQPSNTGGVDYDPQGVSTGSNRPPQEGLYFGCDLDPSTWFTNCIVLFLHTMIFKPMAFIAKGAAMFLDFFVFYSISSDAYTGGFVEKAWSVVRDISNMFFIIALLYVGLKTILGMNTSNNKRAIGMIILIALIINFSLFISKVVVDASNVLAHVFYNNITPYDKNGKMIENKSTGEKSITVGLVRTFDPQKVISDPSVRLGEFALVTILFIILLFYMILMFVSISMLFVARVAGLWIAMIFSPLAFISYILPFPIPGFGHQKWWSELFKLAFMAPIFAFFLYIIILFGGFLEQISYDVASTGNGATDWLDALMKNIIPFILIFVLLKQAKELTKEYSGELGKAFSAAGGFVGGLALGAVGGGVAMLGRGAVGRIGANWANSERLKKAEAGGGLTGWAAKTTRNLSKKASTGSFDIRNAKIAGYGLANTGLSGGLGASNKVLATKTGGVVQIREEREKKRMQRAQELKVGAGHDLSVKKEQQELAKQEILRRELKDENGNSLGRVIDVLEKIDKDIADKENEIKDINNELRNKPQGKERDELLKKLEDTRAQKKDLQGEKKAIKSSSVFVNKDGEIKDYSTNTRTGQVNSGALKDITEQIDRAQKEAELLKEMSNKSLAAQTALTQAQNSKQKAEQAEIDAKTEYYKDMSNVQAKERYTKATEAVALAEKAVADATSNLNKVSGNRDFATLIKNNQNKLSSLNKAKNSVNANKTNMGEVQESIKIFEESAENTQKEIEAENRERMWTYGGAVGGDVGRKIKLGAKLENKNS